MRSFLYVFARGLGDLASLVNGTPCRRLARRYTGRTASRLLGSIHR